LLNPFEEKEKNNMDRDSLNRTSNKNEKIELHHLENEHDFSSAKYHEPFFNEKNLPVRFKFT
jgi:hypothetical protein